MEERRIAIHFALPDAPSLLTMAGVAGLEALAMYGDYDESPFVPEQSPFILSVLGRSVT